MLILVPALLCACGAAPPTSSTGNEGSLQRVVVLHLDTTRVDGIGCYGGIAQTPNIDSLCARGRRYLNAIAPTPLTSPSIAAFMTGRLAQRNGVYTVGHSLAREFVTLAEILQNAGFRTGGFISNMVVANRSDGKSWGFDQGFDVYRAVLDDVKPRVGVDPHRVPRDNAAALTSAALEFVEQHAQEDFFLWMLYIDPHAPYAPPPPYDTMYEADRRLLDRKRHLTADQIGKQAFVRGMFDSTHYLSRYYGEISKVDRWIGALVQRIDALPGQTLWVVTADHGESLGDAGSWFEHGTNIRHPNVNIPLILTADGLVPPGQSDALVANIDLAPTILDLLGIPSKSLRADGRTLRPTFEKIAPWRERMLPLSVGTGALWRGVRKGHLSLQTEIDPRTGQERSMQLYDRKRDPEERRNIAPREPGRVQRLKRFEHRWFRNRRARRSIPMGNEYEMTERLRTLGYLD